MTTSIRFSTDEIKRIDEFLAGSKVSRHEFMRVSILDRIKQDITFAPKTPTKSAAPEPSSPLTPHSTRRLSVNSNKVDPGFYTP